MTKSLEEMTKAQKYQLLKIDELQAFYNNSFIGEYPTIPEDTELCILLRTLLDEYLNNEIELLKGESDVTFLPTLQTAACLLIARYSKAFFTKGDEDRKATFDRLRRHVQDTFNDKYEHSMINPIEYMYRDYAAPHTIICTLKYISRFSATGGRKTKNLQDLMKALHYIIIETVRSWYGYDILMRGNV